MWSLFIDSCLFALVGLGGGIGVTSQAGLGSGLKLGVGLGGGLGQMSGLGGGERLLLVNSVVVCGCTYVVVCACMCVCGSVWFHGSPH